MDRTWESRSVLRSMWTLLLLLIAGGHVARADGGGSASQLGRIDFPVTGSPAARAHFSRGVLALHSFWYDEAQGEFRAATQAEPGFAMGYWGEAMTYEHPIWYQEDLEAGRQALAKLPPTGGVTARERGFIEAARLLYGEGDRAVRHAAYAQAMERLHRDNPRDAEASCFYALALLGLAGPQGNERDLHHRMEAAALVLEVFAHNPNHPGAAHYIIHAFDDPTHAVLALPAALRYAQIAPAAHHARHMPSHIFVQLGMWPQAAASNESAWAASDAWVRRKKLPLEKRDYHSLSWLQAVEIEQGQRVKAERTLGVMRDAALSAGDTYLRRQYATMATSYLEQTGQWGRTEEWLAALDAETPGATAESNGAQAQGGAAACGKHAKDDGEEETRQVTRAVLALARGEAAVKRGDAKSALRLASDLAAIRKRLGNGADDWTKRERAQVLEVCELDLRGAALAAQDKASAAVETLKKAVSVEEEQGPPSGPVVGLTAHERLGELLLQLHRPKEAIAAFTRSLERHPGHARSLLGAARAALQLGDTAAERYQELAHIWQEADADWPGRAEVQQHAAQQASSR